MAWYYIGPDKTGFDCSICCAGFTDLGGTCAPFACSTNGYPRSYVCPSTEFPSPRHVYSWLGGPNDDVTIEPNPVLCGSGDACYTITGGPLNSAGRIGSGCSQTYVVSEYQCENQTTFCPTPPTCGGGEELVEIPGTIFYSCFRSADSCSCYSYSEVEPQCACVSSSSSCELVVCCGDVDDPPGCVFNCLYEELCPNGTIRVLDWCGNLPPDPFTCPECVDSSGNPLTCMAPPGVASCDPLYGYSCSCGVCTCEDKSVCECPALGYSYDAITDSCVPCYQGDWEKEDCCDAVWKRKNCAEGEVCCNDGRCYEENTVLCVYPE